MLGRGRGACSPCQDAHANMRAPHGLAPYIRCMPHKDARDVSLLKHVHVALDWAVPEGLQCCPRGWSVHQHSRGACSGCALLGSPELLFHQLNYVLCAPAGQGHLLPRPFVSWAQACWLWALPSMHGPLKNNGRACMRSCSMVAGIAARFFNLVRAGGRGGAGVEADGTWPGPATKDLAASTPLGF